MRMSKPRARRATARPMAPRPTMPSVAPWTSRPRRNAGRQSGQRPPRTPGSPPTGGGGGGEDEERGQHVDRPEDLVLELLHPEGLQEDEEEEHGAAADDHPSHATGDRDDQQDNRHDGEDIAEGVMSFEALAAEVAQAGEEELDRDA